MIYMIMYKFKSSNEGKTKMEEYFTNVYVEKVYEFENFHTHT